MFVAEMDFPLAPEIRVALREAIEAGDTGYVNPHDTSAAAAFAGFAQDAWGWSPQVHRMGGDHRRQRGHRGIAAPPYPGRRWRDHHAAGLPALLRARARRPAAPSWRSHCSTTGRRTRSTSAASTGHCARARAGSCCATRTTRSGWCTAASNSRNCPRWWTGTAGSSSATRSTRLSSTTGACSPRT